MFTTFFLLTVHDLQPFGSTQVSFVPFYGVMASWEGKLLIVLKVEEKIIYRHVLWVNEYHLEFKNNERLKYAILLSNMSKQSLTLSKTTCDKIFFFKKKKEFIVNGVFH